jgi:UDP-glucose 4-epimerase
MDSWGETRTRRCVVTGGAGFVGSHLVEKLLDQGAAVTAVDNLSTGRTSNIDHLRKSPNFRFVALDAADRSLLAPIIAGCDELYHLASYVGVKLASQSSSQTILNNLRMIDNILDLACHYRPRLLLTSTSEIYGKALDYIKGDGTSLAEDADRVYGSTEVHRWSYAGTKSVEEFLTLAKHHEEGLETVIVRLFNVIGPRQQGRNGPVVPRLIEQALAGEPLSVYGDGSQLRCFTDVSDAVEAIVTLMDRNDSVGDIFNIGNDSPVSIRALAELIIEVAGSRSSIEYVPHEAVFGTHFEDVSVRIPNVSKLKELTGLKCEIPLEETLHKIVEFYRVAQRTLDAESTDDRRSISRPSSSERGGGGGSA